MPELLCGRFRLNLDRPLVMGILNVTPDSFSDGGRFDRVGAALERARQMVDEGADLIDIGGESTRPNAPFVSPEEELARVLPVLPRLAELGVPISLDTRRTRVMKEALATGGVDLINDVSALEDEGALELLASANVAICLMHKQGNPDTMQADPNYADVVAEVGAYLARRVALCRDAGIACERLLGDPGLGFGKTLAHNLALLKHVPTLEEAAGVPMLIGLSRKSMLGAITGEAVPAERLGASVAGALLAAERGARIVRVHDVKATRQALEVWQAWRDTP
ncbi:dihydropteroate synthase [Crenobacter cavernae]|uniref:Dihydropteroate synthase n=1 Tax=Crenobacter cavernae TaxID=2290923 RepID=A0ABY0FEQ1_9NEIS|nr:dihydropteroate synthase [Crenobacter cavernae]RXZ43541.1 dihydropteroate synthase [Crenobacter cavernae]